MPPCRSSAYAAIAAIAAAQDRTLLFGVACHLLLLLLTDLHGLLHSIQTLTVLLLLLLVVDSTGVAYVLLPASLIVFTAVVRY